MTATVILFNMMIYIYVMFILVQGRTSNKRFLAKVSLAGIRHFSDESFSTVFSSFPMLLLTLQRFHLLQDTTFTYMEFETSFFLHLLYKLLSYWHLCLSVRIFCTSSSFLLRYPDNPISFKRGLFIHYELRFLILQTFH
jgi:hypothetical protein